GGMADHRLRLPASQVGAFALALASQIAGSTQDAALSSVVKNFAASTIKFDADWIKYCAEDLVAAKGKCLIVAGSRQPGGVQVLVAAINAALGNIGKTIPGRKTIGGPVGSIAELALKITNKSVQTLFIVGGNPVYNAPADLDWATLQKSVP